jgi:flagellar biogenesis protein FliO
MATTTPPARATYWGPLLLIGVLATVAGLVLPQMLPDEPPTTLARPKDTARSAGDLHYVPPELPEVPSTRALFLRLGGMTAVVLVIGVGVLVAGRHWLRGMAPARSATGQLRLVETLLLGNRCHLHLVQIATRQILVGADATGIKSVVTLTDDFAGYLGERDEPPQAA